MPTRQDTHAATLAGRLDELESQLDEAVSEFERLGRDAAEKARDAEVAYAKVFLAAEGPEYLRKQTATLESVAERFDQRIADHLVATQREVLRRLHASVDMARTRTANARKEIELVQTGVRT